VILQRLAEHYDRIANSGSDDRSLAPPGYSRQKISFCVVLEADGSLNSLQSIQQSKGRTLVATSLIVPGQGKPAGQGINACFLWDNAAYMLGWSSEPEKRTRAEACFESFRKLHLDLEEQIDNKAFSAVCSFLRLWSPNQALGFEDELEKCAVNFGSSGLRARGNMFTSRCPSLPGLSLLRMKI
jgi:CRISPR-associated protein Csd1